MDEPKPLESLFKEKLFRIPVYQRGYAWGKDQLNAFWEDLVNLPNGRSHYTGVLTLKEIPSSEVKESDKEYWLIENRIPFSKLCALDAKNRRHSRSQNSRLSTEQSSDRTVYSFYRHWSQPQ